MSFSKFFSAAILATSLLGSSAYAGVINTFQFVNDGSSWSGYGSNGGSSIGTGPYASLGSSHVFTGSNGLNTTVTFFEDVADNGTGGSAVNGYWGHGLSVIGADGSSSRVDSDGEAILFDFGADVTAKSSFFYGWRDCCNTDVRAFYANNGGWTAIATRAFSGYLTLDLNSVVSDQFLFVNVDTPAGNDTWALKGFAVETIDVPEPGSIALLGLGLVGLGLSRRQAKK